MATIERAFTLYQQGYSVRVTDSEGQTFDLSHWWSWGNEGIPCMFGFQVIRIEAVKYIDGHRFLIIVD